MGDRSNNLLRMVVLSEEVLSTSTKGSNAMTTSPLVGVLSEGLPGNDFVLGSFLHRPVPARHRLRVQRWAVRPDLECPQG